MDSKSIVSTDRIPNPIQPRFNCIEDASSTDSLRDDVMLTNINFNMDLKEYWTQAKGWKTSLKAQ